LRLARISTKKRQMDQNSPPFLSISLEERARRIEAVTYARGSLRLEGFVLSPRVEELNRQYVDGEISSAAHSQAIFDLYLR